MKERQQKLLKILIEQYIKTAQPVASSLLVNKLAKKVSSATVRNEMAQLEEQGYIFQPHTSAGRQPSFKGYQFYVDNFLINKTESKNKNFTIESLEISEKKDLKILAKKLVEVLNETVILGFAENDFYHTGLSNLFSKPEFENKDLVVNLSKVIDHLEQVMEQLFSTQDCENIKILIGENNPFGKDCSALVASFKFENQTMILVLLGPLRMDYQKNFNLLKNIISNF